MNHTLWQPKDKSQNQAENQNTAHVRYADVFVAEENVVFCADFSYAAFVSAN